MIVVVVLSRDDSGAGSGDKDAEYYGPQNWCDKGAQQEVSDDYPEVSPGKIMITTITITTLDTGDTGQAEKQLQNQSCSHEEGRGN